MDIKTLVGKARSIRRFDENRRLSESDLLRLVDAARLAPCGANRQLIRYRLVYDRSECALIFPAIAWAAALKDWAGPAEGERPAAYIVMTAPAEYEVNVGIAGGILQLAAAETGIGACMLGNIRRDIIHEVLKLPGRQEIRLIMALGYPAETVLLEEASSGACLDYYRTADGIHHVPKLRLDDVLVRP